MVEEGIEVITIDCDVDNNDEGISDLHIIEDLVIGALEN